jgi:hypothetical protein
MRKSKASKGLWVVDLRIDTSLVPASCHKELRCDLENRTVGMSTATVCRTVEIARSIED